VLPGVASVEADLKTDRLEVKYDPQKVTPERMLQAIDKLKYPGKVVTAPAP
jgi:copper chaperone CopZ